jgi:hypothetical protein
MRGKSQDGREIDIRLEVCAMPRFTGRLFRDGNEVSEVEGMAIVHTGQNRKIEGTIFPSKTVVLPVAKPLRLDTTNGLSIDIQILEVKATNRGIQGCRFSSTGGPHAGGLENL